MLKVLTLTHLEFRILFANDVNTSFASYNLAVVAAFLN